MMDIKVSFPGGKRVDATFDGITVSTDQPVAVGGGGTAPAPFDLFLASLATCAGYYALAFCQARNLPTEGLRVVQKHDVDPATKLLRNVRIEVTLPNAFPEKYRAAILKAVEGCKVKKTMAAAPSFDVLVQGDAPAFVATA